MSGRLCFFCSLEVMPVQLLPASFAGGGLLPHCPSSLPHPTCPREPWFPSHSSTPTLTHLLAGVSKPPL